MTRKLNTQIENNQSLTEPLVSVVITSYNQRDQLIRAIESVLSQSYDNIQIVIADDCSSKDDTLEVIEDYRKTYPNKIKTVLQSKNVGIPKNKNAGFRACDGDYITYLDGDDFYYKDKIKTEIETFKNNDWAKIVYSNFTFTDFEIISNKYWAKSSFKPVEGNIFEKVFTRDFPYRTLYRCELMKKEVLESINYYDEDIKAFHDWDSRIRMTKLFKVAYNNELGSAYVMDPDGISKKSKDQVLLDEMKYVILKNNELINNINRKEKIDKKINTFFMLTQSRINKSISDTIKYISKHPLNIDGYKLFGSQVLQKFNLKS
ncbi:glycosyltransferase family 2 protein [Psychroserpens sp. Hel_I_66]|uniref:glycosyltransferase family 2 protein n=1 Tax=Psychroserpens sp. Hel_I_66 TaxID=1250004 RepID=UPI00068B7749|nr:glycosyltransferase family 2 protein [Psychroserpens sp. Hel_I_66]